MENNVPTKKYRIKVRGNVAEIRRVVELLFKYGYVFTAECRIRKFENLYTHYSQSDMEDWVYIIAHTDLECKMVLGVCYDFSWDYGNHESPIVTVEEFLVTMGLANPWDFPPKLGDWPMDIAVKTFRWQEQTKQYQQQQEFATRYRCKIPITSIYGTFNDDYYDDYYDNRYNDIH